MNLEPLLLQLIDRAQIEQLHKSRGESRLDQVAIESGMIDEGEWLDLLGREFGIEVVDLTEVTIDRDLLMQFPTKAIFQYEILPIREQQGYVEVAVSDPFQMDHSDELTSIHGRPLKFVFARRKEISDRIKELLGVGGDTINELVRIQQDDGEDPFEDLDQEFGELAETARAPSVIRLVNELLIEAVDQQASDVHIEPDEKGLVVRYRIDGILRVQPIPMEINQFSSAIVTRLKIMSRLNIAEKRLPQDGRIKIQISNREIDVRVSIIPMIYGEGVVLRLLDKGRIDFDLNNFGMPAPILKEFNELIRLPHGIVLVTGPTGSGKSTTLYSALNA
ncbi:MAG: Flp pilus assembly complex ATPase component TadA, partial [Planctomycetaceae bacterium]|nr:Flp pilus assembly complex ATPase component TadA [Planctomycetaceae bacterium]